MGEGMNNPYVTYRVCRSDVEYQLVDGFDFCSDDEWDELWEIYTNTDKTGRFGDQVMEGIVQCQVRPDSLDSRTHGKKYHVSYQRKYPDDRGSYYHNTMFKTIIHGVEVWFGLCFSLEMEDDTEFEC